MNRFARLLLACAVATFANVSIAQERVAQSIFYEADVTDTTTFIVFDRSAVFPTTVGWANLVDICVSVSDTTLGAVGAVDVGLVVGAGTASATVEWVTLGTYVYAAEVPTQNFKWGVSDGALAIKSDNSRPQLVITGQPTAGENRAWSTTDVLLTNMRSIASTTYAAANSFQTVMPTTDGGYRLSAVGAGDYLVRWREIVTSSADITIHATFGLQGR